MTMAAAIGDEGARTLATQAAARVVSVDVFDSFGAVEREWRALESGQTATPYQRFDFINTWQDNVGVSLGANPSPAIAHDAERRVVMVLPLVTGSFGPF